MPERGFQCPASAPQPASSDLSGHSAMPLQIAFFDTNTLPSAQMKSSGPAPLHAATQATYGPVGLGFMSSLQSAFAAQRTTHGSLVSQAPTEVRLHWAYLAWRSWHAFSPSVGPLSLLPQPAAAIAERTTATHFASIPRILSSNTRA